ncbi:leucine-rich PPR motif-containing protein, mitochondrial-like [Centruroides sculpturatus]|uniref:leucine-rich PPR motif-containing protein, mitochondrial-like n=1 Tax=Centruroides sculpturatus TaxID=218467 RepID=UPI000C6ED7D9|nr:leucine-rich PPR motif-containing protein, mitochondrial-like [Centruroides sculpturatus]
MIYASWAVNVSEMFEDNRPPGAVKGLRNIQADSHKILEFMKSKELTINETVFNFLVMGYVKSGNMENAKGILDIMKNAQLEPTADTYTALACGYAKNGDIKGINDILMDAQCYDVFLMDKNYLQIITALAVNGHSEHIDEILVKIKKVAGYNQDCINTILELVNKELEDVGYKLLFSMSQPVVSPDSKSQIGQFFIRQLVRAERPVHKIIEFCQDMKNKGLNETGLLKATVTALYFQKIELVKSTSKISLSYITTVSQYFEHLTILKTSCNAASDVCLHTLKRKNDENEIYKTLKVMEDLECPPNYETYLDYVFPAINTSDENYVIEKLKEVSNQSVGTFVNPLINYYLNKTDIEKAKNLVEKYPIRLSASLIRSLPIAFKNLGDARATVEILKTLIHHPEYSTDQPIKSDLAGQFLLNYLLVSRNNVSGVEALLQELDKMDLKISNNTADIILGKLKNELSEQATMLLEKIATDSFIEEYDDHTILPHPRTMDVEELENHLIELKSKGLNTRGVLRRLLMLHCRMKNLERVIELKKEFDDQNSFYTGSIYAQLIELFVYHKKLDEALHYKTLLEKIEPDFPLDDHKVLNLANLLIKNDKIDDALQILDEHYKKFGSNRRTEDGLERNVTRLLTTIANKGDVDLTRKMFDLLVTKYNYAVVSNIVLGPLVKVHLVNDNLNGAFEEFKRCAEKYKHTPFKNEICKKLIDLEDSEKLQTVVDLNTSIHGELNTLFDLICIFIEAGRIQQARKIVETPGIRAHHKKIKSICERFVQLDMVNELEQFIKLTKDIFDINRDNMYYYLIRAYAKENNVQKALGVWTAMQEEDIQPSVQTLSFLGEYLKKNNEPIPFAIPTNVSSGDETNALLESIQAEDADQALEIKRK